MGKTGKISVSFVVALICIFIYAGALISGTARILVNYSQRSYIAEREFRDIVDRASSAAILGFMSRPYQEIIQEYLLDSQTLLGVIITGSNGEFGFERQQGSVINWFGNTARFKTGFGIARNPYADSVWIEGQRNTTVRAIYSYIDYDLLIRVLRETLFVVLITVALAILVLVLENNLKTNGQTSKKVISTKPLPPAYNVSRRDSAGPTLDSAADIFDDEPAFGSSEDEEEAISSDDDEDESGSGTGTGIIEDTDEESPKGLYSVRGIGWESYTMDRLESELHRCASFEEDLVFIVMETRRSKLGEESFRELAGEAIKFFTQKDLIFEKGEQGMAMIIPALNLDQGIAKSEEFRNRIQNSMIDSSGTPPDLCIGLSSRTGRLVEAERLVFEASQALAKAMDDPESPIIAFRSDPEKYRQFISKNS
jgi:hypothetical protein